MKIVTVDQMRQIEDRSEAASVSKDALMEKAGLAVAEYIRDDATNLVGMRVVVLIGPGNNGGDGLVVARHLDNWGARVTICLCGYNAAHETKVEFLRGKDVDVIRLADDAGPAQLRKALEESQIAIDAVLGTGRARPIEGPIAEVLDEVRHVKAENPAVQLVAVDLPTGLDADSGAVDPKCVAPDVTLTPGHPKVGLYRFPGAEYVGRIEVLDIGLPAGLDGKVRFELMTDAWAKATLPARPLSGHKGTFGKALIVAGSRNYVGAAYLAATAAGRIGAGLVTLSIPESLQLAIASRAVEPTYLPLPEISPGVPSPEAADLITEQAAGYDALLVGPGMGQADSTRELLARLLNSNEILPSPVIDADALNFVSRSTDRWWDGLASGAILTPHPGEMARLSGHTTQHIQENRFQVAVESAVSWKTVVVLKGAFTIVAYPDGRSMLSPFANPAMATAGTGDVLAGAIAGLVAQGLAPEDAAALGVYLHGMAGQRASAEFGNTGMLASDLLPELPKSIKALRK